MSYRTGKYTVCRCVHASFSLEILHAGAVKGLISTLNTKGQQRLELPMVTRTWHVCKYKGHKPHQKYILETEQNEKYENVMPQFVVWRL